VKITRSHAAIITVLVVLNVLLASFIYVQLTRRPVDHMAPRSGFKTSEVHTPAVPGNDPNNWEQKPVSDNIWLTRPGFSFQSRYELGQAFASWGGELRLWINNDGQKDIFIYGLGFEMDWEQPTCVTVGVKIPVGQERDLGIIHFPGPSAEGNHSYTMKTALMVYYNKGDIIPIWKWWDYGYVGNISKTIQFKPMGDKAKYEEKKNPAYYFDKANKLMNPKNALVVQKAAEIAARYPGGYSIYQAAAAFNFVRDNITYALEPKGQDHWQSPEETLQKLTGDCEDLAFLTSALITALNGTTRFHVEKEHAFLSVYAGKDLGAVQLAVGRFYNSAVRIAAYEDSYGYWLCADATNTMYLGGLPLGGQPVGSAWDLTNTTFHYQIDMLPR